MLACERVPLLAPSGSTLTLTSPTTALPINGTAPIGVQVIEPSGTPPHSGTHVTFTTTLGTLFPTEAETDSSGQAIVQFRAGSASGTATISAISGGASVRRHRRHQDPRGNCRRWQGQPERESLAGAVAGRFFHDQRPSLRRERQRAERYAGFVFDDGRNVEFHASPSQTGMDSRRSSSRRRFRLLSRPASERPRRQAGEPVEAPVAVRVVAPAEVRPRQRRPVRPRLV